VELSFLLSSHKKEVDFSVFNDGGLKIDLIRDITKEAYITSDKLKVIILVFNKATIQAQNAMLKILEEPPLNTIFILICPNKSFLLATVLSRLLIVDKTSRVKTIQSIELDVLSLSLGDIYSFIKSKQNISSDETKEIIYYIFNSFYINDIILNGDTLEVLSKSLKLLEVNSKPINVLLFVLISIYSSNR